MSAGPNRDSGNASKICMPPMKARMPRTACRWSGTRDTTAPPTGTGLGHVLDAIRQDRVQAVLVCRLDRLTTDVHVLYALLETLSEYSVVLLSEEEGLDTGSLMHRVILHLQVAIAHQFLLEAGAP